MKIATWNVNSIRARLPRVLEWLDSRRPDVAMLQEIKCTDDEFPIDEVRAAGYHAAVYGQKTYNGVAILSRTEPRDVRRGLPGDGAEAEARLIEARVGDFLLIDVYVVNGQRVGSPAYEYKLQWLERLRRYLAEKDLSKPLVVAGDFNVTFDDRDVYDPRLFEGRILCSEPERRALAAIVDLGLVDVVRRFFDGPGVYTWWDYRTRAFQRGQGLRIDHILATQSAMSRCVSVDIDKEARGGEKPSDHAPVIATFDDRGDA